MEINFFALFVHHVASAQSDSFFEERFGIPEVG
jgi:hypothetical protein